MASALAAIVGALLICWRFVIANLIRVYRFVIPAKNPKEEANDIDNEAAAADKTDAPPEKPIPHHA